MAPIYLDQVCAFKRSTVVVVDQTIPLLGFNVDPIHAIKARVHVVHINALHHIRYLFERAFAKAYEFKMTLDAYLSVSILINKKARCFGQKPIRLQKCLTLKKS